MLGELNISDSAIALGTVSYLIGYLCELVCDKGIAAIATINTNWSTLIPYYGDTTHAGLPGFYAASVE